MTIKPVDVSVWYDAYRRRANTRSPAPIRSARSIRTISTRWCSSPAARSTPSATRTPQVDALIDKAAASADEAERKDLYKQIRTIVTSDAPLVFAHYETLNYLMNKNVTGSAITPTLSLHMENVGFTE